MSCLLRIKEGYSTLSKNEKKIADYIISNNPNVYDLAVKDLAELSKTTPSCIIRFTKKLGFDSYTQFRIDLAKDSEAEFLDSDQLIDDISNFSSVTDMAQTLRNFYLNTINKTFEYIDFKKIEKAISIISKSKKICIVGEGTSLLVGKDLCNKFIIVGLDSCCHEDAHTQLTQVNNLTPNDCLIALSYSGFTELPTIAIKRANQMKVPSITISQNSNSTLTKKSTVPLFVPALENERKVGSLASRTSCTIITDLLYLGTIHGNIEEIKVQVIQARKLLKELKK